jgi:DNA repair photolyase
MIISASRRTDIPAFYSEWFMNRIREGYLFVQNPFNAQQIRRVDLSPDNVDIIVFWSKNPQPILRYLDELDERGYRYYFQFTFTAYPKLLEPSVAPMHELLGTFKTLSTKVGQEKVVWRFDPIIVSDVTPEHVVIDTFERLARQLRDSTSRVVISFVHLYKSVIRNLERLQKEKGVRFYDNSRSVEQVRRIAATLADIAHTNCTEIVSCAEKLDLSEEGIQHGKCIDDRLIKGLFGITVPGRKDKNQRMACQCVESQDIGQYNTCTHGCMYCYAASNRKQAHTNRALHDPKSPFLIRTGGTARVVTTAKS